jgi:RND family efflux transporter MFP subunit
MFNTSRVSVSLLVSCVLLTGCEKKEEGVGKAKGPVEAVAVALATSQCRAMPQWVDVTGTLFADQDAQISAKVAGRVTQVMADVGDRVESGAPLAQIDPSDYELARLQSQTMLQQALSKLGLDEVPSKDFDVNTVPSVRQAAVAAENAKSRYLRTEKLFKETPPLISEQEYLDARTAADVAKAGYEVAVSSAKTALAEVKTRQAEIRIQEQRIADATVRAPQVAGVKYAVASRCVSSGEYVKEAAPMYRVIADDPIRFRAAVPERYAGDVKVGQKAQLRVEGRADAFEGTVARVNPQIDPASRTFVAEINAANAKQLLRSGAFATGRISVGEQQAVTFVPAAAVVSFAGVKKVFTVKDGMAVENEVVTGETDQGLVQIVSGLRGTPEVVTTGAFKLAKGTPVKPNAAK